MTAAWNAAADARLGSASDQARPLIELKHVSKIYHTVAGDFSALKISI